MPPDRELLPSVDLNLWQLQRHMVRFARSGLVHEEGGLLLLVATDPGLRLATRTTRSVPPEGVLERAARFFEGDPNYAVAVNAHRDADLERVVRGLGYDVRYAEREMVLRAPPSEGSTPEGVLVRPVDSPEAVRDFAEVLAEAFEHPAFAADCFLRPESLLCANVAAFLAYAGEEPVCTSMTLVSHGAAGVFWVATVPSARGRGLGDALTRIATRAGFELGARFAWLGATEMGAGLYGRIGFEDVSDYKEYAPPTDGG